MQNFNPLMERSDWSIYIHHFRIGYIGGGLLAEYCSIQTKYIVLLSGKNPNLVGLYGGFISRSDQGLWLLVYIS